MDLPVCPVAYGELKVVDAEDYNKTSVFKDGTVFLCNRYGTNSLPPRSSFVEWLVKLHKFADEIKEEQATAQATARAEQKQQEEQSTQWASQGRCRYCGGQLSFLGKKCKACEKKN